MKWRIEGEPDPPVITATVEIDRCLLGAATLEDVIDAELLALRADLISTAQALTSQES